LVGYYIKYKIKKLKTLFITVEMYMYDVIWEILVLGSVVVTPISFDMEQVEAVHFPLPEETIRKST